MFVNERDVHQRGRPAPTPERGGARIARQVGVAPTHERCEDGEEITTRWGQVIVAASTLTRLSVLTALEDACSNESFQTVGKNVG